MLLKKVEIKTQYVQLTETETAFQNILFKIYVSIKGKKDHKFSALPLPRPEGHV